MTEKSKKNTISLLVKTYVCYIYIGNMKKCLFKYTLQYKELFYEKKIYFYKIPEKRNWHLKI